MGRRAKLASTADQAGDTVAAALDSAVSRGRKARKQARAEALHRQKQAKARAQKQSRKARRRADKFMSDAQSIVNDARADAAFRGQALAAAAHGKPKKRKGRRLIAVLGLAGAAAAGMRARGAGSVNSSTDTRPPSGNS